MVKNKSMWLNILCWIEAVVAARVLLFTAPVLINKCLSKSLEANNISDWFILLVTMGALLHFVVGIAAIVEQKGWRGFHFISTVLVFSLTGGLVSMVGKLHVELHFVYFLPLIFSALLALAVLPVKTVQKAN